MTKNQFNSLDILEQVEYINSQLENNKSITAVCKDIGIGRSTIRDRFKKVGFLHSKELNRYKHNDSVTDVLQSQSELKKDTNNRRSKTDIHKCNNVGNTDVVPVDKVTDIINKSDVEIKETIIDIVNNYDVLKEMIDIHRRNTSVIKQQIIIDIEESDSKLVTIRVNTKELELFNKFCDDHKQYKKIDLISQALKEFRENHS